MDLQKYLESGEHLPEFIKDFHDQKDFFKSIYFLYRDEEPKPVKNWVDAHVFTIDWFLWFMASRGYTLQKCRKKNVEFKDLPNYRELTKNENLLLTHSAK